MNSPDFSGFELVKYLNLLELRECILLRLQFDLTKFTYGFRFF